MRSNTPAQPDATANPAGRRCAGTWRSCASSSSRRSWARRAGCRRRSWPRGWRRLLDPLDLGAGVVTVDRHVPRVADQAGRDAHLRVLAPRADQGGGVDLAPDLAIVQGVFAAAREAAELAGDVAHHRFVGAEAEEAAVLVLDLLLGRGRGLLGLGVDGAVE